MDYPAGFLGMRGTGDFTVDGQRPESWREMILRLYPNGAAPLTAIMSKLTSEKVTDPIFHWYQKILPRQRADITGIYTDVALATAYVNGGVAGDTVYVKMSAADVAQFMPSHIIMIRLSTNLDADVVAKVTATTAAGAASYLTCTLLEADDNNTGATAALANSDIAYIIGTSNAEGAKAPSSLLYDPTPYSNYTQIFRNSLEHTRTAMLTSLRTGDQVKEARREALELHSIEMEKAFIFGVLSSRTGSNNKPERTTKGIRAHLTTNKFNFKTAGAGAATWKDAGEEWLDDSFEQLFRYGTKQKLCLCGSGAIKGINKLAKASGTFQLTASTKSYGIQVLEWVTAQGTLAFKEHPLFTYEPTLRNACLVVEPRYLKYRYITDTKYKQNIGDNDLDGELSEFLTEAGLEVHFEQAHAWFDNVGVDRT